MRARSPASFTVLPSLRSARPLRVLGLATGGMVLATLVAGAASAQGRPPAHAAERHPAAEHHAAAAPRPAGGPKSIGTFADWQAATHEEGGQLTCYAFVRGSAPSVVMPGRGEVVLTVTERPGAARDAVAVSAGYTMPASATPTLQVDATKLELYTDGKRSAFARDGHAAVTAMGRGSRATFHAPAPRGPEVSDGFSLRGFAQAYAAILKACPAGKA